MLAEKQKKAAKSIKLSKTRIPAGTAYAGKGSTRDSATEASPVRGTRIPSTIAPRTVRMTVNGRPYSLHVEPNYTLRDVLRQKLGFTSVKDFCNGYGACGSCAVIMDGRLVNSCLVLGPQAGGSEIITIEGVHAADGYSRSTDKVGVALVTSGPGATNRRAKPASSDARR